MDPRDALPRASCCRQRWTLSVANWPVASIVNFVHPTDDRGQFTTLSVQFCRKKLTRRCGDRRDVAKVQSLGQVRRNFVETSTACKVETIPATSVQPPDDSSWVYAWRDRRIDRRTDGHWTDALRRRGHRKYGKWYWSMFSTNCISNAVGRSHNCSRVVRHMHYSLRLFVDEKWTY